MAKINNRTVLSDKTKNYAPFPAALATQGRTQAMDVRTPASKAVVPNTVSTQSTSSMQTAPGRTHDAVSSLDELYASLGIVDATPTDVAPIIQKNDSGTKSSTTTTQASTPTVADPYAGIYSLYDQLRAERENAAAAQRQANINKLQANYNNAKSQLDSSFNAGETELNQTADEALRQAFISNKLNQRDMAQYLAGQGVTGGAAESILAKLFNSYGNNRNSIERDRANQLRDLLANYQGTLGNIESTYLSGMADADSDYSNAILSAVTDYYGNLAELQKQNINNQYSKSLGKSGSSTSSNTNNMGLDKDILSIGKSYKGNAAGYKKLMDAYNVPEEEQRLYQMANGNDPDGLDMIADDVYDYILEELGRESAKAGTSEAYRLSMINNRMQQLQKQYGLTDEQARLLLEEAGY